MKYFVRILSLSPIIFILSLFLTKPALALPPFPSSFYGTIMVNDANVPDGTLIQALIGGQVCAEGYAKSYQDHSFYALDIRGNDTDTAALDGGREGDTVQFKIGGLLADQTAVWHGGMNVRLDLTTVSSEAISPPEATPRAVPTQTAMVMQVASPLPGVQASPVPTLPAKYTAVAKDLTQPLQVSAADEQPASMDTSLLNGGENGSGRIPVVVVVIALPILSVVGFTFLALRRRKM